MKNAVKVRDTHKIEKCGKTSNFCIKKCCEDKYIDLLLIAEESKRHLSEILTRSYMILQYIVECNIFVVTVYMLSVQKKY